MNIICCLLWDRARLKWTEAKIKTLLWSDSSKCDIIFRKHGCRVLHTIEDRTVWFVQPSVLSPKACISDAQVHQWLWIWQLAHLEMHHEY